MSSNLIINSLSTTTPLGSGESFTSPWVETSGYPAMTVACKTDVEGTLQVQFSPDMVNVDSTLSYQVDSTNEVHRVTLTRRYVRVVYTNGSVAQSYMRLQSQFGFHQMLTSPLNFQIGQDADAQTVRAIGDEIAISAGIFTGLSFVNKFGYNPSISSGTVPEDICGAGGLYAGFPTGSPELVRLTSTSANDTAAGSGARKVVIIGLDANWNVQTEEITLSGTTPAVSANTYRRVHTASVSESGSSNAAFNAGDITCAHNTTTTNVFFVMLTGRNQTNESAYTVPAGYTAYIRRLHGLVRSASAVADVSVYVREFGKAPKLRRPTSLGGGVELDDNIFGGLRVPEKSDVMLRCDYTSGNNLAVSGGYDLLLVKN